MGRFWLLDPFQEDVGVVWLFGIGFACLLPYKKEEFTACTGLNLICFTPCF